MQPFFPPTSHLIKGCNHKASRCSIHITTLPHSFPHSSPPHCHFSFLSSLTHSPVLRRPQQEKPKHCSTLKALRSPPLLVRCHTTHCPLPLLTVTAPHAVTLLLPGEQKMCVGVCVWIVVRGRQSMNRYE